MMKKIYIAGKVTGLPIEEVSDKFKAAQVELENQGFTAVNPLVVVNDPQANWNQAMKKCIGELVHCDAVYLLPCHINSPGAQFELQIAARLEIPVCREVDSFYQYFLNY